MNSGDQVNFQSLPFGFCSLCLERMQQGANYRATQLGENVGAFLDAYCEHREVGATILLRPGRPMRWHIVTPIDALEWEKLLELKIPRLAVELARLAPVAPAVSVAHATTHPEASAPAKSIAEKVLH